MVSSLVSGGRKHLKHHSVFYQSNISFTLNPPLLIHITSPPGNPHPPGHPTRVLNIFIVPPGHSHRELYYTNRIYYKWSGWVGIFVKARPQDSKTEWIMADPALSRDI